MRLPLLGRRRCPFGGAARAAPALSLAVRPDLVARARTAPPPSIKPHGTTPKATASSLHIKGKMRQQRGAQTAAAPQNKKIAALSPAPPPAFYPLSSLTTITAALMTMRKARK